MLAEYSFLPWLRRGIANQIKDTATDRRALIEVTATVTTETNKSLSLKKMVQLVGAGDIIGINRQMIFKTEPRHLVTDFEPNFLPFIEFYDEDFPWRYTPAPPPASNHRLTPWLTLLVVKENEFERKHEPTKPLPSITLRVPKGTVLPKNGQMWAWAHVHLNEKLNIKNHAPDPAHLDTILKTNPDKAFSRLLCPRKLDPETPYFAFLIPTFEVGRRAGLGIEENGEIIPAVKETDEDERDFPVYYEWFFRTASGGDFEELVRLLQPRDIDERVGIRDMDVQHPGFGIPFSNTGNKGLVGLEGALLAPTSKRMPEDFDKVSEFPEHIEMLINREDDLQQVAKEEDPTITPPLYGRWHALVKRLSRTPTDNNWINEMNLDTRARAAAGFGTRVIQKNQEAYMRAAWQQIGDVITANNRINFLQWAMLTSHGLFIRNIAPQKPVNVLPMLAPVFSKVMGSPVTIHYLQRQSNTPRAATSGSFRKLLRPRGLFNKRFFPSSPTQNNHGEILSQISAGKITAAPPRATPASPNYDDLLKKLGSPRWLQVLVKYALWLLLLLLILLAVLVYFFPGILSIGAAAVLAIAAVMLYIKAVKKNRQIKAVESLQPRKQTPIAVDAIPARPNFELRDVNDHFSHNLSTGATDSETAANFRAALKDYFALSSMQLPPAPVRPAFDLQHAHTSVIRTIAPLRSFPNRMKGLVSIGKFMYADYLKNIRGEKEPEEKVDRIMAYPDIKDPMYEPLRDIDTELLVPNLKLIPPNTISLMMTNQKFIESYMVGLNHEFVRELLWREYPTDQRASVFRQFWDVSGFVDTENLPADKLAEKVRDIKPIHGWSKKSLLGKHNNRDEQGDEKQIVLVIRGDLLKRYPNTVIYAQRAKWGNDPGYPYQLVMWDETGEISEANNTDKENIQYPLYSAKISPDIHFIGFDLTIDEVKGAEGLKQDKHSKDTIDPKKLGWYFVIKERPGEACFGLDISAASSPGNKWDNLAWPSLGEHVAVIDVAATPVVGDGPNPDSISWGTNSADMAYILYQKPVLVAVHGMDMLKNLSIKK